MENEQQTMYLTRNWQAANSPLACLRELAPTILPQTRLIKKFNFQPLLKVKFYEITLQIYAIVGT